VSLCGGIRCVAESGWGYEGRGYGVQGTGAGERCGWCEDGCKGTASERGADVVGG
jgi:hypothetical protein